MTCFKTLNASTVAHIWYYLEGRIDFDKSKELGQFFFRTIYANLAVSCRSWMVARESDIGPKLRNNLLAFYDSIPASEDFAEVDWDDFFIVERTQKQKRKKPDKDVMEESYVTYCRPPKKIR